jgi:adenosylcobinamide kinase/adenosylcobinamide-phosphate guanylyltransferase
MPSSSLILVTGPTRSGKSEWAEFLANSSGCRVTYVATAQVNPEDAEWQARLAHHQQRRPAHWQLRESPNHLDEILQAATVQDCLLIDSLGTWVVNYLDESAPVWEAIASNFLVQLAKTEGQVILVSEETGWGVVPAYASGRCFRDRLGTLTRQVAQLATAFYLVIGGYALDLKQSGQTVPEL